MSLYLFVGSVAGAATPDRNGRFRRRMDLQWNNTCTHRAYQWSLCTWVYTYTYYFPSYQMTCYKLPLILHNDKLMRDVIFTVQCTILSRLKLCDRWLELRNTLIRFFCKPVLRTESRRILWDTFCGISHM